jgi:predicted DNA-binding transcriptional regulator YafY
MVTPLCHHCEVNRTDRLYAIAEELRRAGRRGRTAVKLAGTFEVSVRTIKRDVSALQQAGLPVWARPGAGGGYVLDAAASLPPVNFTPAQAVAVALALSARPAGPFAGDGLSALGKVVDVMDPASLARAEALAARLWVRDGIRPPMRKQDQAPAEARGAAETGGIAAADGKTEADATAANRTAAGTTDKTTEAGATAAGGAALRAVEAALAGRVVVALRYRDRAGRQTRRRVEPHLLACDRNVWYLIGWCLERDAVRWFRWDRIEAAHVTTQPVTDRDPLVFGVPPPDAHPVDLAAADPARQIGAAGLS